MNKLIYIFILLFVVGCSDKWEEHDLVTDPNIKLNLYQKIKQDTALSAFATLLENSGYDTVLAGSKSYTVWAPSNTAIQSIPDSVKNTGLFVAGHISIASHLTSEAGIDILTLAGKYHLFTSTTYGDANITVPNAYANNGILHKIDKAIPALDNIWTYIQKSGIHYLPSLDTLRDTLNNEAGSYTYFLPDDDAWQEGITRLSPHFITGTTDSTQELAGIYQAKSLLTNSLILPEDLPDSIKENVTATYRSSNGIVYTIKKPVSIKFSTLTVEGEHPLAFSRTDKAANIFYRVKADPGGNVFRDIEVYGHATAQFYIQYQLSNVPSGTYKVYWRAVAGNGDAQTVDFTQRLAFQHWDATDFAYTAVHLLNYDEVYLGEYTTQTYGTLNLFLVAANSATAGVNTLSLDYLKLVPTF